MQSEAFINGLIAFGIGVVGVVYDWLRYSMQKKGQHGFARTRLVWGSWALIVVGTFLMVMAMIHG